LYFDNLTLGYDRHPTVHHLNYAISAGALVAVVEPNRTGKWTPLKMYKQNPQLNIRNYHCTQFKHPSYKSFAL